MCLGLSGLAEGGEKHSEKHEKKNSTFISKCMGAFSDLNRRLETDQIVRQISVHYGETTATFFPRKVIPAVLFWLMPHMQQNGIWTWRSEEEREVGEEEGEGEGGPR